MEENETVTDVTDETPESENNFPYGPVFLALAAGATSAAVTAKIMKLRQAKKKSEDPGVPVEIVDGEIVPPTDLR